MEQTDKPFCACDGNALLYEDAAAITGPGTFVSASGARRPRPLESFVWEACRAGDNDRAGVHSLHVAHGQNQEADRAKGRRLNRLRVPNGVGCDWLRDLGSGPSPQPTDAPCARGEELQANGARRGAGGLLHGPPTVWCSHAAARPSRSRLFIRD